MKLFGGKSRKPLLNILKWEEH